MMEKGYYAVWNCDCMQSVMHAVEQEVHLPLPFMGKSK